MIPFFKPKYNPDYILEIEEVLKSGWITTGPKTKLFESQLTEYCGNKKTLCVNAATNGLELILRWYGVGEGDEVILPAYTYCATANVVIHCGAKPVFVDIDDNFNISAKLIRKKINKKTKVIMPVDFAGFPCDYDAINRLATNKDVKSLFSPSSPEQEKLGRILILSDAAHSIGATYKGKRTGSLTDVSVFSFHAVKNLTTAEGGAICLNFPKGFNNDDIYKSLNTMSLHGQSKDALAKNKVGDWKYDVHTAGYKCNMTDLQAALGLVELRTYESDNLPLRKKQFYLYSELLSGYDWAILPVYENKYARSSFHVYPLRIKGVNENERDAIIQHIFAEDVSVNVHFRPVPMLSYYQKAGYTMEGLTNTYKNFSQEITLPVYSDLSDEDIKQVVGTVAAAVEKVIL